MSENTWCRRDCLEELGSSLHSRLVTSSGSWTIMDTLPDSGARLRSWMKLIGLTVISSVWMVLVNWLRGTESFWGTVSSYFNSSLCIIFIYSFRHNISLYELPCISLSLRVLLTIVSCHSVRIWRRILPWNCIVSFNVGRNSLNNHRKTGYVPNKYM